MKINGIITELIAKVRKGVVIPAHPLALDHNRKLDERRQRALSRYYIDAGADGLAIGVHTTQFAIRDPKIGLFEPVLQLASETIDEWSAMRDRTILKIAGICGKTSQAVYEAEYAVSVGYHAGLLSLGALAEASLEELIAHCRTISSILPIVGFYLQPAVGGRILPYRFWREFVEIENILAIKIAPFNRYQTLDVIRAVCDAGRENDIALYTGNDDNIVIDLLSQYRIPTRTGVKTARIVGGLLGQWAVWTKKAVELLNEIHDLIGKRAEVPSRFLSLAIDVTDSNAALFDVANSFSGCIAGIHEVLRRQGLMQGIECLNPSETLSIGQMEEIDRVCRCYPYLADDEFVRERLNIWLHQ